MWCEIHYFTILQSLSKHLLHFRIFIRNVRRFYTLHKTKLYLPQNVGYEYHKTVSEMLNSFNGFFTNFSIFISYKSITYGLCVCNMHLHKLYGFQFKGEKIENVYIV